MSPALELHAVAKSYGRTEVIRGATLAIERGERVALIGPNGAGKSTLFDLISGRQSPSAGRILLHGERIDGLRPVRIHRRGLTRSFQISHLFSRLSAFENLRCAVLAGRRGAGAVFWRSLKGLDDVDPRTENLLARLHLGDRRHVPAAELAHAEQRALEIGITIAGDAATILLDEPTAGMSHDETTRFIELIRDVTQGKTLLMVEHDMNVVFGLADRIAVLARGEVIAYDTPAAVRADPRVRDAYLGGHA